MGLPIQRCFAKSVIQNVDYLCLKVIYLAWENVNSTMALINFIKIKANVNILVFLFSKILANTEKARKEILYKNKKIFCQVSKKVENFQTVNYPVTVLTTTLKRVLCMALSTSG